MRWLLLNKGVPTGTFHDDGIICPGPGFAGFTRDGIDAHTETLGADFTANYFGPSEEPPAAE